MGGDGKEGLVPFLETAKITSLKIVRRYNKMIDAKGNGKCGGQVTDEKVPIGCLCIHQCVHHALTENFVQHLLLSGPIQKAIGRVGPQHIQ